MTGLKLHLQHRSFLQNIAQQEVPVQSQPRAQRFPVSRPVQRRAVVHRVGHHRPRPRHDPPGPAIALHMRFADHRAGCHFCVVRSNYMLCRCVSLPLRSATRPSAHALRCAPDAPAAESCWVQTVIVPLSGRNIRGAPPSGRRLGCVEALTRRAIIQCHRAVPTLAWLCSADAPRAHVPGGDQWCAGPFDVSLS